MIHEKFKVFIVELIESEKFVTLINALIREKSGTKLINLLSNSIDHKGRMHCLEKSQLFELLIGEFEPSKI